MPQPPAPLELSPEPESILPEIEVISAGVETIAEISSAPDGAVAYEPIPFHGIIVQAAGRYEVDPHLIRAIIFAESGYNPRAKSKKGARGLMQLMPSTAKSLGVEDSYDPEENIDGGVRYFRSLL
ncbi:MAG: transglycosylase SLT domain-containing protein, partial [Desulfosarcina sp.]|nr:transglycosylase SLT domain-containing protein [Desulfosarcina sp.]MBC2767462.1 transglycosylase SLT domain-containing protein [Desulfosarcina sp.]